MYKRSTTYNRKEKTYYFSPAILTRESLMNEYFADIIIKTSRDSSDIKTED
ncbi:MAG: hypothetical protein K2X39_01090 [Silvanigrellaceae bacterium]|nr:hypothetical protein [Silvanigrellaceae bacterium]